MIKNATVRSRKLPSATQPGPQNCNRYNTYSPRPAGSLALLQGAPDADVVIAWHIGFDGLDTFGGILNHLKKTPPPVRFVLRRIERSTVPTDPQALASWLDDVWLDSDQFVHQALTNQANTKDKE